MTLDQQTASALVDACAAAIVFLGIGVAATRSIGRSIWLVAAQSILTGLAAVVVGLGTGAWHLVVGGLLAVAVKGFVVPVVLGSVLRRSAVRRERHLFLGRQVSIVAAVAIVFVAGTAVSGAIPGASIAASRALPAATAEVLTGLLIVMTRRKALSLVLGLLIFENGIALTAFSLTYGMPFVVELGVLFDVLVAVVVAWVYAGRMLDVLGSTSTDQLRNLRG
jgi:hydrogenase-4 component E